MVKGGILLVRGPSRPKSRQLHYIYLVFEDALQNTESSKTKERKYSLIQAF